MCGGKQGEKKIKIHQINTVYFTSPSFCGFPSYRISWVQLTGGHHLSVHLFCEIMFCWRLYWFRTKSNDAGPQEERQWDGKHPKLSLLSPQVYLSPAWSGTPGCGSAPAGTGTAAAPPGPAPSHSPAATRRWHRSRRSPLRRTGCEHCAQESPDRPGTALLGQGHSCCVLLWPGRVLLWPGSSDLAHIVQKTCS